MAMTRLDIIWFYYFWMCVFRNGEIMCVGGSTISKFTKNKSLFSNCPCLLGCDKLSWEVYYHFCNSLYQKMQALSQSSWTND
jgi:hypothetical protein